MVAICRRIMAILRRRRGNCVTPRFSVPVSGRICCRSLGGGGIEQMAATANRGDEPGSFGVVLDLTPQSADLDGHRGVGLA
mgnify:CR=1 FL=1